MRRRNLKFLALALVLPTLGTTARAGMEFEQRVEAQRAIEQVYWTHRNWPRDNPVPKPALAEVLSEAELKAKVDDTLRQSIALASIWSRPVTEEQLQAELNRMIDQTHDGARLLELFHALGDDPARIAESLARPVLVRRLIHDWYAFDPRFHGELRARAEAALQECPTASCMGALGGAYRETTWRPRDAADSASVPVDAGDWQPLLARLARAVGGTPSSLTLKVRGGLVESADAFTVTAVLSQRDREVRVATTSWAKRPFDAWWAERRESFAPDAAVPSGTYTLQAPQVTSCTDDTWTAMPIEIPDPRTGHTAVWTGSEMIVWGGSGALDQATGARYDPATDTWVATSMIGAPAARNRHTAVWTGTTMIVWGGGSGTPFATGSRYNPTTDTWAPTSTGANLPAARSQHTAIWTGTEMIVWGGDGSAGQLNSGGRYDPGTDTWTATSIGANVPTARNAHTAVWTGTQMIVWGGAGSAIANTGGRYTPGTDSWTATSVGANVPAARFQHTAVWTGSLMVVWGGQPGTLNSGGRYNPTTNAWTTTSIGANVPGGRMQHTAVWTGSEMIVWGGHDSIPTYLNTGGRYNPTANTWTATSTGTNVPAGRYTHTAVWTGTEMIVWGGATPALSYTGGRYNPTTNSWVRTSTGSTVPTARYLHSGVWTGAEMLVWGGRGDDVLDTGGRYDPVTSSWSAIPQTGAPAGRIYQTTVWTGTKMIVWGGGSIDLTTVYNTGGAFDPTAGTWTSTSVAANVPDARYFHTAVWTGSEMIVWGGRSASTDFNTGGRYAPATDSWTATSTGANVPSARNTHTAVWTGSAMVVWGSETLTNTGGRYFPATDSWLPTSVGANVPAIGTTFSSSVWTGSRVIIWGGFSFQSVNTGAVYDPVGDAWTQTSTGANCPSPRYGHSGLWTGTRMIIWGGGDRTGGRYDPDTNTWTPTSTGAGCPDRRSNNSAILTGSEMIVWGGAPTTATGGRYCACALAAPAGAPALMVERPAPATARLAWTYAASDAAAFDAVRGDLAALRATGGDFSAATGACVANDAAAPVDDADMPSPGAGFWYLLRAVNCGGNGSYGSAGRDAGIAASGHDCD